MTSIVLLGFLMGIHHALEVDHVAAVASLAIGNKTFKEAMLQGSLWGVGHTLTILVICSVVLLTDTFIPDKVALLLEMAVGIMLVILGADLVRRLLKDRIHFHIHAHDNGNRHLHAHQHNDDVSHEQSLHDHDHQGKDRVKALGVGFMHGMAGSSALIILTVSQVSTPVISLSYIALFGAGSIVGMALFCVVIAVPMRKSGKQLGHLHRMLKGSVGIFTIMIGIWVMYQAGYSVSSFH